MPCNTSHRVRSKLSPLQDNIRSYKPYVSSTYTAKEEVFICIESYQFSSWRELSTLLLLSISDTFKSISLMFNRIHEICEVSQECLWHMIHILKWHQPILMWNQISVSSRDIFINIYVFKYGYEIFCTKWKYLFSR